MPIYLTNIASMQARRNLANVTNRLNTSFQRLSSGLRINSAKDDPAGLQIANRMSSQINGLSQANRNTADAQAFAQTYEGALDETVGMLQKIRTLAVQSANGTLTSEDREAIEKEVNQLGEEITRIAEQTKYGGKTIMLGKESQLLVDGFMSVQVGAYSGDSIKMDLTQSFRLKDIYDASRGENADPNTSILDDEGKFKMSTAEEAQNVLGQIDKMIQIVDSKRGDLGAYQNRFDSIMRNASLTMTNMADARSRIRDTDFAAEASELFRNQILQQTSVSMLMQANSQSNLVLRLLGA